jgi:hypothetical protein
MKANNLYNFISPVTGRVLSTYNYVLMGNSSGIAIPSPMLMDIKLDLINLTNTLNNSSLIIGFPNNNLPNAQVLSNLEDGAMINTGGIVSTTSAPIPIQATYIIQVPDAGLTEAQPLSLLGTGIAKIVDNGVVALAIADEDYASFSTIESYTQQALDAAAEANSAAVASGAFASAAAASASSAKASATTAATAFAGVATAATVSQSAANMSKYYAKEASSAANKANNSAKLAKNIQINIIKYANLIPNYTKQSFEYANKSANSAANSARFANSASSAAINSAKSASAASDSATSASTSASSASDSATAASTSATAASDSATAASTSATAASDSATAASTSASSASDSATAASTSATAAFVSATSASTSASSASDSLTTILEKLNYGALYISNNTDITYITANTYTKLVGTTSVASVSSLFTSLADNQLNYTGSASVNVFITANVAISHNVMTGTTIGIGIYKNGIQIPVPITAYQLSSNVTTNLTISVYTSLSTNDYLEVWGSTTDNSQCIAVNMNFLVNLI